MTNTDSRKAVIYCRVAGGQVAHQGDALASQDARCREYAEKGYEIAAVFHDVESGTIVPRPGISDMLDFLAGHRSESFVVIVDSMSALARDVSSYVMIRDAIRDTGATLKSPSFEFGEGAAGILTENLFATIAQFEGEWGAEQDDNRERNLVGRMLRAVRRRFQ